MVSRVNFDRAVEREFGGAGPCYPQRPLAYQTKLAHLSQDNLRDTFLTHYSVLWKPGDNRNSELAERL
jgi:hypothetical protein